MKFFVFASYLIFFVSSAYAEATKVRVNQTAHPLDAYAVDAIRVALNNMDGDYELVVLKEPINQTRAVENLEAGTMDLMWLATNAEMEERLQPIRFPLLKGLLGHRIFIINAENQSAFDHVQSLDDVKRLSFGQGQGWPDVDILRSNDLTVVTTSKYEGLFHMVEGGRFDGFPRGVLEPWSELASHSDLALAVESELVLVYKLPFYLYVSKSQSDLAVKLKNALDKALVNGEFDAFYYSNKLIVDALTRSNLAKRKAFYLSNPTLTAATPLAREDYWLDIKDL